MDQPDNQQPPGQQTPSRVDLSVDRAQALHDVSQALLAMRDALTQLSLALKDWQFEHDLGRRDHVQGIAHSLLTRLAAPAKPIHGTHHSTPAKPPGGGACGG